MHPYRQRPAGRDDPTAPPRGHDPEDRLVDEAISLVVRTCATRVAIRTLKQLAGGAAPALEAAASRCEQADGLGHRVRGAAAQLLRGAASEIHLARRRGGETGTIRI